MFLSTVLGCQILIVDSVKICKNNTNITIHIVISNNNFSSNNYQIRYNYNADIDKLVENINSSITIPCNNGILTIKLTILTNNTIIKCQNTTIVSWCGNGILDEQEECDFYNNILCNSSCLCIYGYSTNCLEAPTKAPTEAPTKAPTKAPTMAPTEAPTEAPTKAPTKAPIISYITLILSILMFLMMLTLCVITYKNF